MKSFKDLREKTLTAAEKKKREEIAKAMERDNPGMDMKKKMAIATWQAKKVAEQADGSMCCKHCGDEFGKPTNEKCMYDAYDPKGKNWVKKESYNEAKVDEISLSHLSNKIANSTGTKNIKTAMKPGEVKKGLDDLKKRLATLGQDPKMAKEAYEEEPASPDEKSMAMRQAKFIQYVGDEIMEHLEQDGDFPEWMQNKLSELHQKAKDMHSTMAGSYEDDMDESTKIDEISKKTLGSYVKKASADVANRSADNARDYATGNRPIGANKKAMKNMKRTQYVNKAVDKLTQEETQIDEVLDTPKAMDSYRNKAKYSKDRAANSAAAKMLRNPNGFKSTDTSDELHTMDKRAKGLKMADRAATRKTRAKLMKKEDVMSADKKPEKYIKPDGKVGIRMVRTDKKVVDKNA